MPVKPVLKHMLARGSAFCQRPIIRDHMPRLFTHKIPVLCYHSVNSVFDRHVDPIPLDVFNSHIEYLSLNWNLLSVSEFSEALADPKFSTENCLVITFDDGYRDNYEVAASILQRYRAPAIFFVPTGFINKEVDLIGRPEWGPMSWEQITDLAKEELFSVGSHSHSHTSLSKLSPEQSNQEIFASKKNLEDKLGKECRYFAYPNGQVRDVSSSVITAVKSAGYDLAFSTLWHTGNSVRNKFLLNRVMINASDTVYTLAQKCRGNYDYIYTIGKIRALSQPTLKY